MRDVMGLLLSWQLVGGCVPFAGEPFGPCTILEWIDASRPLEDEREYGGEAGP